jgi:hypothetical protein
MPDPFVTIRYARRDDPPRPDTRVVPFAAPPIPVSTEGQIADATRFCRETWPIFAPGVIVPFAIGIYGEMIAARRPPNLNVSVIKAFLKGWTTMPQYLRAVAAEGAVRYHADGSIQGPVTVNDRQYALSLLGAFPSGDPPADMPEWQPNPSAKIEAERYWINHRAGLAFKLVESKDGSPFNKYEYRLLKARRKPRPEEVKRLLTPPRDGD